MRAIVFILALFLSIFVRGQQPANAGTTAVVNPVLPDFLPISSQAAMLDWAVTNNQWETYPLVEEVAWSIDDPDDLTWPLEGASSTSYEFHSWDHFLQVLREVGLDLAKQLLLSGKVSPDKRVYYSVVRGYGNLETLSGANSLWIDIDLGSLKDVTAESFLRDPIKFFINSVVRIEGLERFQVSIDDGPWLLRSINLGEFINLTSAKDVFFGERKVRYLVTAKGVTGYYTQTGAKLVAPVVSFDGFRVFVKKTPGSVTVIETSEDLKTWSKYTEIGWQDEETEKSISVYPLKPKQFFRAYSK